MPPAEEGTAPEKTVRALEKAREDSTLPGEYFAFRIALARSEPSSPGPDGIEPEEDIEDGAPEEPGIAGRPLLDAGTLAGEAAALADRARVVGRIFAEQGLPFGEDLAGEAASDGGQRLLERLRAMLARDTEALDAEARSFAIDRTLLSFFLAEVVRPFLRPRAAAALSRVDGEKWQRGYCPACGSEPYFAKYEGEGRARFLACPACDTTWRFPRATCPFCGEAKPGTQGFLHHEDETRYRIDVCRSCRRYLKSADLTDRLDAAGVVLRAEDARTLYLDLAAEKEGFRK